MCSLSVIVLPGLLRVVMNRDEQDDRPLSRPPLREVVDGVVVLRTVDGLAGGAWLAIGGHGVVAAVLNHAPLLPLPARKGLHSRGLLPLAAVRAVDHRAALAAVDPTAFLPFTLVTADADGAAARRWDGRSWLPFDLGPGIAVSSGLGDHLVEAPRAAAWARCTVAGATPAAQDAWHADRSGADPAGWVLMRRTGARTVDRTVAEVTEQTVTLENAVVGPEGRPGPPVRLVRDRR